MIVVIVIVIVKYSINRSELGSGVVVIAVIKVGFLTDVSAVVTIIVNGIIIVMVVM